VSDTFTREALGARIFRALQSRGNVREHVWDRPRSTPEGIDELMAETRDAEAFIAWDQDHQRQREVWQLVHGREYSVFATSPMNAYTTRPASIPTRASRSRHVPLCQRRVFDLGVLARCPQRLVAAAFAT
jgi:glycerol-1-phosphate dehydrogenase [NAD(P)+]